LTRTRVVLVDDNALTLNGFAHTLSCCHEVDLVAAIAHQDTLNWDIQWCDIDVVIVDAADEGRCGDQFPGVGVVQHIRTQQDDRPPTVIVVTGHFFNDGLRHRMAEANADFFFLRSDIRSPEKLIDIVLNPMNYRRGVPPVADTDKKRALGINSRSRIEDVVDYVEEQGLDEVLARDRPPHALPSRRSMFNHRKELGDRGRIDPMNWTTSTPPNSELKPQHPSLGQLRRVWAWSARVKYGPVDESQEDRTNLPRLT
jgi:DNA-binding NarL/FixJ family response regulator